MGYFVYVIRNPKGKCYIGQSSDIEKRLARHNSIITSKSTSFTKSKGPWTVIYKEVYTTREDAKRREKELKSFRGREFIKKIAL